MVAVTVSWIIGFFFANLLQCAPISKNWIGLGASSEFCIDTNQMYIAQAWSDVFTDGILIDPKPIRCRVLLIYISVDLVVAYTLGKNYKASSHI